MPTVMDTLNVELPEWAVVYLEYGKDDSLPDSDKELIDTWVSSLPQGDKIYYFEGESYFTHYPEFGLPCQVVDTTVTIRN